MYLRAVPFNMGLSNFGICTLEWKLGWGKDGNCVHFLHCFRVLTGVWFSPVCPRSAGIKCCWATDSFSAFNFYTWMETWSWNENNRVWRTGKSLSKTISMNGSSWTSWFNYLIIHIQSGTDFFKNINLIEMLLFDSESTEWIYLKCNDTILFILPKSKEFQKL